MWHEDRYPYQNFSGAIQQLTVAIKDAMAGKKIADWIGPGLQSPVDHVCIQPGRLIEMLNENPLDSETDTNGNPKLERLVWLAFQFGVCQGYAMKQEECVLFGHEDSEAAEMKRQQRA